MAAAVFSIVVPVLNEAALIAPLLRELRQRLPQAELVVVDGGSGDDTVRHALPLCDQLLIGEQGRAAQMNLGALAAAGDYLFFLHADSLPDVHQEQVLAELASAPEWGFSPLRLTGRRRSLRLIAWFINWRSRLTSVATGDQMQFARRELFLASGGFDAIPLMEDVALSKRLRRHAAPHVMPWHVLTSSRRWEEGGVVRTVLRMWSLRLAYFLGVHPDRLVRFYYGR